MEKIAILTSGGDAPGMNAAVRSATRAALARGWEVFGVRNGYAGLLADTIDPLHARDVGGIEALVVIGGNGSQTGAHRISQAGFAVVGIASTIDNDLFGTDVTIGVDTAVNTTLLAIDQLRTTGSSHQRAFLVETMGRNCGYIALMTGIAGGAEVIATPECEIAPREVAERLAAAYRRGKTHAIVVVAEGAKNGAEAMMRHFDDHRDTIGFGLRVTQLGHVVRGGVPTAFDRVLAPRLGAAAIDQLAGGTTGVLMGIICNAITAAPLA